MFLPAKLTLYDFTYFLDGGTTALRAIDELGQNHAITLVQHAFPQQNPSLAKLPGRLYWDGQLVPMRSDLETGLLSLLQSANVQCPQPQIDESKHHQLAPNAWILGEDIRQVWTRGPEDNLRALSTGVVKFVESDEYLRFANRVEQAADPTRYKAWIDWNAENRNNVVVRLSRILGIGLRAAREILDGGTPIADDATALEMSKLIERYSVEGLALRTEPTFRWNGS